MSEAPPNASRLTLPWRKKVLFTLLLCAVVFASLEIALNVLSYLSPTVAKALRVNWNSSRGDNSPTVTDDVLGYRPCPNYRDHDQRGFRNASALDAVEIVCLGDSQTYGTGVQREEAWPQRLGQESGHTTYNMACGGWGPTHSEAILSEALALRPQLVVAALYSGNDLWDCFNMVYQRRQLGHHLSDDADLVVEIRATQERDPIEHRIASLFRVMLGEFDNERTHSHPPARRASKTTLSSLRSVFSAHSRLYGLARAVRGRALTSPPATATLNEDTWQSLSRRVEASGGRWVPFELNGMRTIFVPEYRMAGLDAADIRIREGHRIALDAFRQMQSELAEAKTRFLVVLIPTKELVFSPYMSGLHPVLDEVIGYERQMWAATKSQFEAWGIAYVDSLPALQDELLAGRQPYKINADGHLNAVGHRAVARALLRELGLSTE